MSGPTKKEDARKIVLARRARFVTAAIASVGIACGTGGPDTSGDGGTGGSDGGTCQPDCPKPCLSVATDSGADTSPPQPCLTAPLDSGLPNDAGGGEDAGPQPCLSPPPGPPHR